LTYIPLLQRIYAVCCHMPPINGKHDQSVAFSAQHVNEHCFD